ncbi:MAG: hypothetical protein HYZ13_09265 [Acidobacteria bacterium]|nr:hypothetical protein [Acidobacteriota bacterium]
MILWIAQLRAAMLGLVAGGVLMGFLLLRFRPAERSEPLRVHLGHETRQPQRDLSPASSPRTVVVARVEPGRPAAPPVSIPADLAPVGGEPSTTLNVPMEFGGNRFTLHAAFYPQILGPERFAFRSILWGQDVSGAPLRIGEAVQVDAHETTLALNPAHRTSPWRAGPLVYVDGAKIRWGAAVAYQPPERRWCLQGVAMGDRIAVGVGIAF